jgi:hypothetical protein
MEKKTKKYNLKLILLSCILLFGLFLRIYALGVPSFWVDESISAITAQKIVETGVPVFDSGMSGARANVFHYIQAFFMLFGQTDFVARFISVIAGLLTIFLAYKFGNEYSKSGGLISSLFVTIFYLEVFYSRQARMYQMFQLFFFLTIYLLYKSKDNPKYIYLSILSFFITLDTQIQGLVLAPFLIGHILIYGKKQRWLSIFPAIPIVNKFFTTLGLTSSSVPSTVNYFERYFSYASNMLYLLILFVPGLIWAFVKNKRLTILTVAPAAITLLGVFTLKTFALRYSYFFIFAILLYSALLFAFLYDKYGKLMLIPLFLVVLIPSNIFYPQTYVNVISPIDYQFSDSSAPFTDYKVLPAELSQDIRDNTLISYFSLDAEWYLKKPDYVLPFSMNGMDNDQISYDNSEDVLVDRYSGAQILTEIPEKPYYLTADRFSVSKLDAVQMAFLQNLTNNCSNVYSASDLNVFYCAKP